MQSLPSFALFAAKYYLMKSIDSPNCIPCFHPAVSGLASGRVETVRFQSKLVNATLPYNVILPRLRHFTHHTLPGSLSSARTNRSLSDWVTRSNVADYAAEYRMIVVTPEGNDGWYTDSATVATDKYESYILKELIPDVQQRYRTIEARYGRSIAGLSMGGYGAFKFGLKSPGTFVFAGSMSGAFGVTRFTQKEVGPRWDDSVKLFGPTESDARLANDLFDIIDRLPEGRVSFLPYFYFDCGTEDAPLIFTYNRQLSEVMLEKKIPHEFRQLPGDHSWGYWDRQVQEILKLAAARMRMPPPKTTRTSRA